MFPLVNVPCYCRPHLLNGPGCVFYRCADPLVCSSGRTYLYLLLFNTSLRVSFSITSALFRSSVLRTRFGASNSLCFINSHHLALCDFLQSASLEAQNASAAASEIQVVSNNNRGELMLTMQLRNEIENALCRTDIEVACGLVGEKELWFRNQGSRQRDSLLLSA